MKKYWLVGATWKDKDMLPDFIIKGIWKMGWDKGDKPLYDQRISEMKIGDRIAVKRLLGQGNDKMVILAIGIITHIEGQVINVNWVMKNMTRKVSLNGGCFGTISNPFTPNGWIRRIFTI